ncbi:MAG: hypothetical protein ACJ72H_03290 [Candidatus Sulfotelmatobacter sp.]
MTALAFLGIARAEVEHKTKFDREEIPAVRDEAVTFPLSNSRQIVRTRTGQWLVAFDVPNKGLFLAYGAPGCAEGSGFQQPVLLVGDGTTGILARGTHPKGASLAAGGGFLYLSWSDASGVWVVRASLPAAMHPASLKEILGAAKPAELIAPGGSLGDLATDSDGRALFAYSTADGVFVATQSSTGWVREKIADSGSDPAMEFSRDGRLHLAFTNQREVPFAGEMAIDPRISYTVRGGRGWQLPQIAAEGLSFFPAIATAGSAPVIAFQYEGMKSVRGPSPKYLVDREGGGSSIGYASVTKGIRQTGFVSEAQEMLVRSGSVADGSEGALYPMVEQKWRPRMAVDKYGIPWAFWPDTTRRHTYFARWLGSRFSDPYECRGGYYAPSGYITVEKHMPSDASEIGFAYAAAGRLYFGTVPVPAASTGDSRHFLFLDMLEVSDVRGARKHLNQFKKYSDNPVLGAGAPGTWDDFGLSFPNVRFDGVKFTMEYSGHGAGAAAGAWGHGYAESTDGIHWIRPRLGLRKGKEGADDNQIPWVPNFLDTREPDPAKRYKGVLIEGDWIKNFQRRIAYSPDAIHWQFGEDTVNLTSMLEGGGPSFRDDRDIPERRFKSVGRTLSQNHRALGMMWSSDLIHWHGEEAILDVDDPYGKPAMQWRGRYVAGRILDPSGEKTGDQIYWGTVWIENGLYLCLYAPFRYDGGYQAALAVSRDGLNYMRVNNGEFILPRGPAGAWDSGIIAVGYGFNIPIHMREKIRVYYGGVTSHHGTDPWRAAAAVGMAELPSDGWSFISPELSAQESYITTIPVTVVPGHSVHLDVNADVPPGRGSLQVEVLDAKNDMPLVGYSRKDCHKVSNVSGAARILWNRSDAIPLGTERLKFRFYLAGAETRLYSFRFN